MKKAVGILAGVLLLIVAGFGLPSLFGTALSIQGSAETGLPYSIGSVSVNPFTGSASVSDVVLLTAEPFKGPYIARVGTIEARFDASTLLSDFIVVNEVIVRNADIRVEQSGSRINIREVAARFKDYLSTADTTSGPRIFIHELRIEGARGSVATDAGSREFQMTDLVLRDVGSESAGTPIQVLAGNVLEPIMLEALKDAGTSGLGDKLRDIFRRD
ncbi:MAG: hypothetical protein ACI80V_003189 [Rhodothermales bacterium]|jgi:hypothetical protein